MLNIFPQTAWLCTAASAPWLNVVFLSRSPMPWPGMLSVSPTPWLCRLTGAMSSALSLRAVDCRPGRLFSPPPPCLFLSLAGLPAFCVQGWCQSLPLQSAFSKRLLSAGTSRRWPLSLRRSSDGSEVFRPEQGYLRVADTAACRFAFLTWFFRKARSSAVSVTRYLIFGLGIVFPYAFSIPREVF